MNDLLNGAGPLVTLSALPMLAGLLLREGVVASNLRRLAIILALVIPVVFMALVAIVYVQQSGTVFFDFSVNNAAANVLYTNGNPYSVAGAYSFPFPSFYLYWLGSGWGALSQQAAWIVWWIVNGTIWLLCVMLLWRTLPRVESAQGRDCLSYAAVAIPAITVLWQGQTALLILIGLVALHFAGLPNATRLNWIVGGVGLAWATLIKPQLALIGVGLVIYAVLAFREKRSNDFRRIIWIIMAAIITTSLVIGATLILPGGVTLDTYRHFVTDALPQVARPADTLNLPNVIGSPAFVSSLVALQVGMTESTSNLIGNVMTLLMVGAALWWTVQRTNRPLTEIAAGWGVWAMVIPRVTWTWYAAWCLPFFLLMVSETVRQRRTSLKLIVLVLVLGLLNLQYGLTIVALTTILLLIALTWTSFKEPYAV
ncbi:MAG: hypothetical protein ABI947_13500 [Chloroflexota bacterium]